MTLSTDSLHEHLATAYSVTLVPPKLETFSKYGDNFCLHKASFFFFRFSKAKFVWVTQQPIGLVFSHTHSQIHSDSWVHFLLPPSLPALYLVLALTDVTTAVLYPSCSSPSFLLRLVCYFLSREDASLFHILHWIDTVLKGWLYVSVPFPLPCPRLPPSHCCAPTHLTYRPYPPPPCWSIHWYRCLRPPSISATFLFLLKTWVVRLPAAFPFLI